MNIDQTKISLMTNTVVLKLLLSFYKVHGVKTAAEKFEFKLNTFSWNTWNSLYTIYIYVVYIYVYLSNINSKCNEN